jgi:DNA-binding NarL/FixJ family response regulator
MIKILIADDHPIVRKGIKQLIDENPDLSVVDEAKDGREVLEKIQKQPIDVLLLDISLPIISGFEIINEISKKQPQFKILVLSMHPEEQYAVRVLKAGAAGYLTKESAPDELIKALRKVAQGGKYITASLAEKLAFDIEKDGDQPSHELLSDREYQVMLLLGKGKTVGEIGKELFLSVKTISTYRSRILEKMGMKSNAEIIRYVIENKLVD